MKLPGDDERIIAFGWIMFGMMMLYILVTVLIRGCAVGSGLTPNF